MLSLELARVGETKVQWCLVATATYTKIVATETKIVLENCILMLCKFVFDDPTGVQVHFD